MDPPLIVHLDRGPGVPLLAPVELEVRLTQRLGDTFPIEDIRAVTAGRTADRSAKPPELAVDRFGPDPAEPARMREVNGEKVIPTAAADEDDPGPGL